MSHPRVLLDALGIRALKRLSQNFLTSPHWADTLVGAALVPGATEVWEVGSGLGALTERLLARSPVPVKAFELDRALSAHLRKTLPALELTEGDFLDVDLGARLAGKERVSFLSNVPYGISSPLLLRLLPHRLKFLRLVLTFQREYGERLSAGPRSPDYGSLSILIQTHFRLETLGIIPPGAFYPKPDVDSIALVLRPLPAQEVAGLPFERVVRTAFQHRRKRLASNLKGEFPRVEAALEALGLGPNARPEELSREQFVALARFLAADFAVC